MIALPGYVDKEAWDGFVDMRLHIRKPLTVRAAKLIVYELQRIKDAGHDPNAALDQSTNHCWADVYPAKEKPIQAASNLQAERTTQYLSERDEHDKQCTPMPESLKRRIRRVS